MSVIMAIRDSGRVWMAADTQVSCEELKFHTVSETNYKISKLPDGILVGFSGDVRIRNLLVAHSEWFGKLPRSGLTKRFLVTRIVPRLLWLCKENGLLVEASCDNGGGLSVCLEGSSVSIATGFLGLGRYGKGINRGGRDILRRRPDGYNAKSDGAGTVARRLAVGGILQHLCGSSVSAD